MLNNYWVRQKSHLCLPDTRYVRAPGENPGRFRALFGADLGLQDCKIVQQEAQLLRSSCGQPNFSSSKRIMLCIDWVTLCVVCDLRSSAGSTAPAKNASKALCGADIGQTPFSSQIRDCSLLFVFCLWAVPHTRRFIRVWQPIALQCCAATGTVVCVCVQ